jgi:zinc protease
VLREDLGGTYGVSVRARYEKEPQSRYTVTIDFACDPTRTDELVQALFKALERFRQSGPTRGQVVDERLALQRDFETSSRDNAYLLNQLAFKYQNREDVTDVFDMRMYYDALTPVAVRDAAKMYLDPSRYVKVTLMPERTASR